MTLREMMFAVFVGTGILWVASAVIVGVTGLNAIVEEHKNHEALITAISAAAPDVGGSQTLRPRNSAQTPDGD